MWDTTDENAGQTDSEWPSGTATEQTRDKRARERERKAAYRERQRLAEVDEDRPWEGLIGEEREQAIRASYGYAASETRTQSERDQAAARMLAGPSTRPIL